MLTTQEKSYQLLSDVCDGDVTFMIDILDTFIDVTPKSVCTIQQANSISDWNTIELKTHQLKSSYNILGLIELKKLAQEIELLASYQKNNPLMNSKVAELEKMSNLCIQELVALRKVL